MPPLSTMTKVTSLPGFEAAENPANTPSIPIAATTPIMANPYRRCPLPPFSATIDTLRQFDESGKIPTRRVIPLPIIQGASGGSNTVIEKATSSSTGSSSSSSTSSTSLISQTVSISFPSLAPSQVTIGQVSMSRAFQLLQLSASQPVEIRLYSNATTRATDSVRLSDTAVPFEVTSGLITDVIFDTTPYVWAWQNRVGANADAVTSSMIYYAVINPSSVSGVSAGTAVVTFLPLEK